MLDNTSEEIPNSSSTSTFTPFSIVVSVIFTHDRNWAWVCVDIRGWSRVRIRLTRCVCVCVLRRRSDPGSASVSGLVLRVTECNEAWNPHCLTRPAKTPRPLMSDWLNETEPHPLVRKQRPNNGSQHPEHIINNKTISIIFTIRSSVSLKG